MVDEGEVRLLIVDDNESVHAHLRMILAPRQEDEEMRELEQDLFASRLRAHELRPRFTIDCAFQGHSAEDMVHAACSEGRPYALAFVDVRMPPGLDGIETLSRMWRVDPRMQAVLCTAYSDHTWDDIVRALGHSDGLLVLRKPFDPIEALQLAHALTRKWKLSRELERQLKNLEGLVDRRTRDLQQTNARLHEEIAQRVQVERDLSHMATHDPLTGLPNRILLNDRMATALTRADRRRSTVGVLLLDLDSFKDVNDSLGHPAGDELLKEMARRLKSCVRSCDTVARLGGDEFVVVVEDVNQPEEVAIIAQRIVAKCSHPAQIGGHAVQTPPSIGIALYPADGSDCEELLKCADLAMYQAKRTGGASYRYYASAMLSSALDRMQLREQLKSALSQKQFVLWYQPVVDVATGLITGVEALLRWQHPEFGLVPPMKFIPLAEKCGLIVPIGNWVLESACQQLAEWHAQGLGALSVAVNVSARQLRSDDFVDTVAVALKRSGIDPCKLEIEVTESAAMEDFELSLRVLEAIAALGVRIAIDDFGAAYSSLLRLKALPIHILKIDRFFIRDVVEDERDAAIVTAIVGMAHALGLTVVAEGIERIEQLDFLRALDFRWESHRPCDRAQGFLLSKPLSVDAARSLLLSATSGAAPSSILRPNWDGSQPPPDNEQIPEKFRARSS